MTKQDEFREALYEAVIYSYGKVFVKYDTFTQDSILRDIGKEVLSYLKERGFSYDMANDESDIRKVFDLFVNNGFVDRLESEETEKGEQLVWHGLYGAKAYERLQKLTQNPFISCPLNACLLYEAEKYGKQLALIEKDFDLENDTVRTVEVMEDSLRKSPSPGTIDDETLRNVKLIELAEQKQRELELTNEKLLQNQLYLRTIIDNEPECVKVVDRFGKLVDMNPAGLTMLEADTLKEAKSCELIEYVSPQSQDEFLALHQKVMNGESGSLVFQVKGLKGGMRWLETHAVPMYDKNKEVEALLGITRDITEQKISQEKIEEQRALLIHQERQAQMGEMLSMIAHQWRQPLSAISSISMNLHVKQTLNTLNKDDIDDGLEKIDEYTKHLSQTIDDFKNYLKDDKRVSRENLNTLVENSVSIIKPMLINDGVSLEVEYRCMDEIITYTNEVKQVLVNLLSNAYDALMEGEVEKPFIKVVSFKQDKHYCITVEDNGGGIPEENMDRIFEPYFSTKDEKKGTGLGLYMSKSIMEQRCEGELRYENTEHGTRFVICLQQLSVGG